MARPVRRTLRIDVKPRFLNPSDSSDAMSGLYPTLLAAAHHVFRSRALGWNKAGKELGERQLTKTD
jgi:hypothetical protein